MSNPSHLGAVPRVGARNVWVEDSLVTRDSVELVQSMLQQALVSTTPGELEVIVFDDALTGLAAPFETLNRGGERLLRSLFDLNEFTDVLSELRQHIQAVNNVVQGRAPDLRAFRQLVDYPVEGFKLVVISTDYSLLDEQVQNLIATLLKSGPRAGVSFLVHSMTLGVNPFVIDMCQQTDAIAARRAGWQPSPAAELIGFSTNLAHQLATTAMATIEFASVQPLERTWYADSIDGVTFSLGRYGLDVVEVTLGDELNQRHNVLITGAVGQGKSNLISVMIHSLAQRYSPQEVELYLLDFKEGVTLQPFYDQGSGEFLPHAKVLGLEADREFGLSCFRYLFDVYKRRMRTFKQTGVQSLKQYREANPSVVMPRIVVVIDEFQMMFAERDQVSDQIADLLVKGVRLFRACGIHIVLASQTIGGNLSLMGSAGEGLFGQVPIRIALKNSLSESHATLGINNDGAVHLRSRQAIVNLDYGNPASNRRMSVAYADESVLSRLRQGWWRRRADGAHPPYVFEGERRRTVIDDLPGLRRNAEPRALLGASVDVHSGAVAAPMSADAGRNIAVVGAGDGITAVASAAVSLAAQTHGAKFVVLDASAGALSSSVLRAQLEGLGAQVREVAKPEIAEVLRELATGTTVPGGERTFVLGFALDRCRDLPMEFEQLCRDGAADGIHLIGWWSKYEIFRTQVGYGGEAYFDVKVALRMDAQSAKQFFNDPLLEWRSSENRAMAYDALSSDAPVRIIPYTVGNYLGAPAPSKE